MSNYLTELQTHFDDWGELLTPKGFLQRVNNELAEKEFDMVHARLVFSVCPDDINRLKERRTIENTLTKEFNGEFHLGGLGAYPVEGVAGITAASHHPPDKKQDGSRKDGNLIFFVSPHMGLVEDGEFHFGKIIRPGQKKMTAACGATMGFFNQLKEAGSVENFSLNTETTLDPTKVIFYQTFLNNYADELQEILSIDDEKEQIATLFKLNYTLVNEKATEMIEEFLRKEDFHGNIAVIGGLTINSPEKDFFLLRNLVYPTA